MEKRGDQVAGPRIRNVHEKPGVIIRHVSPGRSDVEREEEKQKKIAARQRARDYFHENADGIALLMGGRVEDEDGLHLDTAEELRGITIDLYNAGLFPSDAVKDAQRSLEGKGVPDTTFASDVARMYGRLLTDDRERFIQEGIDAEAAQRLGPQF